MKKIMLMCFVILISVSGCGKANTLNTSVEPVETTSSDNADSVLVENEDNDLSGDIPKWLSYLAQLKQDTDSIYLNEDSDQFAVRDNRFIIPESNILIVASEIGGRDISAVEQGNSEILDIIKLLKENEVLKTEDIVNPDVDAHWMDLYLDVVFLTVDGEYYLMKLSIRDDDRIYVRMIRNADLFSFYMISPELCERIKSISGYWEYDLKTCGNIKDIKVKDSQNNEYTLSEAEIIKMKEILGNTQEKTDICKGPYDIQLIATQDGKEIYMKWCNDDCRMMEIEGISYRLNENDAEWFKQMLAAHGFSS
ncbi:MAG: hypothetical protein NC347_14505 [Clostridium sp.]|nr:hypothetical protein [Clostridium sp.]